MTRALAAVVLTAWAVLTAVPGARASVVVPMSLADLTDAAPLIVDATVAEVRHVAGPDGTERLVLVRVTSTWRGEAVDTVYVRLPGGRIGRVETRVPGVPSVEQGDRLVWFLTPHPRGGYAVLGLHQGALRTASSASGDLLVLAPARGQARSDRARVPRRLDELAAEVRRLLAGAGR